MDSFIDNPSLEPLRADFIELYGQEPISPCTTDLSELVACSDGESFPSSPEHAALCTRLDELHGETRPVVVASETSCSVYTTDISKLGTWPNVPNFPRSTEEVALCTRIAELGDETLTVVVPSKNKGISQIIMSTGVENFSSDLQDFHEEAHSSRVKKSEADAINAFVPSKENVKHVTFFPENLTDIFNFNSLPCNNLIAPIFNNKNSKKFSLVDIFLSNTLKLNNLQKNQIVDLSFLDNTKNEARKALELQLPVSLQCYMFRAINLPSQTLPPSTGSVFSGTPLKGLLNTDKLDEQNKFKPRVHGDMLQSLSLYTLKKDRVSLDFIEPLSKRKKISDLYDSLKSAGYPMDMSCPDKGIRATLPPWDSFTANLISQNDNKISYEMSVNILGDLCSMHVSEDLKTIKTPINAMLQNDGFMITVLADCILFEEIINNTKHSYALRHYEQVTTFTLNSVISTTLEKMLVFSTCSYGRVSTIKDAIIKIINRHNSKYSAKAIDISTKFSLERHHLVKDAFGEFLKIRNGKHRLDSCVGLCLLIPKKLHALFTANLNFDHIPESVLTEGSLEAILTFWMEEHVRILIEYYGKLTTAEKQELPGIEVAVSQVLFGFAQVYAQCSSTFRFNCRKFLKPELELVYIVNTIFYSKLEKVYGKIPENIEQGNKTFIFQQGAENDVVKFVKTFQRTVYFLVNNLIRFEVKPGEDLHLEQKYAFLYLKTQLEQVLDKIASEYSRFLDNQLLHHIQLIEKYENFLKDPLNLTDANLADQVLIKTQKLPVTVSYLQNTLKELKDSKDMLLICKKRLMLGFARLKKIDRLLNESRRVNQHQPFAEQTAKFLPLFTNNQQQNFLKLIPEFKMNDKLFYSVQFCKQFEFKHHFEQINR